MSSRLFSLTRSRDRSVTSCPGKSRTRFGVKMPNLPSNLARAEDTHGGSFAPARRSSPSPRRRSWSMLYRIQFCPVSTTREMIYLAGSGHNTCWHLNTDLCRISRYLFFLSCKSLNIMFNGVWYFFWYLFFGVWFIQLIYSPKIHKHPVWRPKIGN